MTTSITVTTTANYVRRFILNDHDSIQKILADLKRSSELFSGTPLIISSAVQTEIFAPSNITCIEIETQENLTSHLPGGDNFTLTAMTAEASTAPFIAAQDGTHLKNRIDFFFRGGSVLNMLVEGDKQPQLADRLKSLTHIFTRPVIAYHLPQGGIGLMNPKTMTRAAIFPGLSDLPSNAWIAEPD
jgi:hypothetical protein